MTPFFSPSAEGCYCWNTISKPQNWKTDNWACIFNLKIYTNMTLFFFQHSCHYWNHNLFQNPQTNNQQREFFFIYQSKWKQNWLQNNVENLGHKFLCFLGYDFCYYLLTASWNPWRHGRKLPHKPDEDWTPETSSWV